MKTEDKRVYALIQAGSVSWIFTHKDLPEYNESDIEVADITGLASSPDVGWIYIDGVFSPPEGPSQEEQAAAERLWRDGTLTDNQWLTARHRDELDLGTGTTLSAEQFTELLVYRKALRDWPEGAEFPLVDHRPSPPSWLVSITQ